MNTFFVSSSLPQASVCVIDHRMPFEPFLLSMYRSVGPHPREELSSPPLESEQFKRHSATIDAVNIVNSLGSSPIGSKHPRILKIKKTAANGRLRKRRTIKAAFCGKQICIAVCRMCNITVKPITFGCHPDLDSEPPISITYRLSCSDGWFGRTVVRNVWLTISP